MIVLDPTVSASAGHLRRADRLASLAGTRIGLVGNAKPMADVLLQQIGELLAERYGVEWELVGKSDSSRVAPAELLDSLSARSHAIITGVGD